MMKEIDGLIDAMTKVSRLADLRANLNHAKRRMMPRCGNCSHWMKSNQCPKEVNVKGRSQGPSCEGIACKSYVEDTFSTDIHRKKIAECESEIALINL